MTQSNAGTHVPVLVITGPVGVGKTVVLTEVTHLLAERGVPHAGVDLDALSEYFPRPADDPFGTMVALRNLADVWRNYQEAGAERLIIAQVLEARDELAALTVAVPGAEPVVCRLRAPVPVLQERVRRRELGAGLSWHVERAAELADHFERTPVADIVVDTEGRSVRTIAEEILARVGW